MKGAADVEIVIMAMQQAQGVVKPYHVVTSVGEIQYVIKLTTIASAESVSQEIHIWVVREFHVVDIVERMHTVDEAGACVEIVTGEIHKLNAKLFRAVESVKPMLTAIKMSTVNANLALKEIHTKDVKHNHAVINVPLMPTAGMVQLVFAMSV